MFSTSLALAAAFSVTAQWAVLAEETKPQVKSEMPSPLSYTMKSLDGKDVELSKYKGKVVLVVNVASECGLTGQYKPLQRLHDKYKDEGFVVLGFPCNQFGKQEPGSEQEIKAFCRAKYDVSFDMFSKVDVNGDRRCGLYQLLTSAATKPQGPGDISWNFEKFLINRQGEVIARFAPKTSPTDEGLIQALETALAEARPADAAPSGDSHPTSR